MNALAGPGEPDFRAIFDSLAAPHITIRADDPVFTVVAVNSAYAQVMNASEEQILGRSIFEALACGDAEGNDLRASLRGVIATKTVHTVRCGERSWNAVNSPVRGSDGEVRFIVQQLQDATERRRLETEKKLLDVEARFQLAFAEAPIGMVLLTPAGKLVEVNQAYVKMLGYTREELTARDSSRYTHPDDVELTRNFFEGLQHGTHNSGSIEKRYYRKDGELLWTRASAAMRRDNEGRPAQVIAIVEDITAHKRAETRYRFLAESIPQMVWTATPDGMLDYVNAQGTAYFEAPQSALLGAGWLDWVHPEDQENAIQVWTQSLQTGNFYEVSFRLKRGCDSSWRWHLVRAVPFYGENGAIGQWFGTCTDIQDQRQADANLHQQWLTFDTALSNTPDLNYILDLAGRFTYANAALLSLWGKTLEEALGKNFFELEYPAELAEKLEVQIQQVIATLQPVRDQTWFTGVSGKRLYYDYILVPVLGPDGRARSVAGSTRDITEHNFAATQIEEDRRRWRDLLLQTPAAIAVLRGPHHTFEWANPEYGRLVGRPEQLLIGKTVAGALPEVASQVYMGLLDGVYQSGKPWVGREALVMLDRGEMTEVYVNFVYLPTRDVAGEIDGVFVHVTDVSDMVIARKKLEESERQFRTLAESIPHLAWMADETGSTFWYNRRWFDYTGTTLEQMQGWGWQVVHDPKLLPEVLENWRRTLASGEPFEMTFPLRRADGEFRTFLTRVEPMRDNQGRVVRWFGTNTDITEQRRTEVELRRMNRELEEFAYVASHDLQEPLRMVNIYTELILKNPGGDAERLTLYSGFVRQGVLRMEALIRDLLTFSRSVHSEELPTGTADLSVSLAEALSVMKGRIEDAGAVIRASPLPLVRGDTAQMAHVFQNVLSNALKYRKTDVPPEIDIRAVHDSDTWIISVQDNGIGFDPQYAERIFGLFKRLHKDEYPGTGLGLAICKRIVEKYGGRVWADSKLGEGATFYCALPRPADS